MSTEATGEVTLFEEAIQTLSILDVMIIRNAFENLTQTWRLGYDRSGGEVDTAMLERLHKLNAVVLAEFDVRILGPLENR